MYDILKNIGNHIDLNPSDFQLYGLKHIYQNIFMFYRKK